jgi:hypothetical protein
MRSNAFTKNVPGRADCDSQAIREIIENSPQTGQPNFRPSTFTNDQMREMPCFTMNRDGFQLLAMGFTGTKALQWGIGIEPTNQRRQSGSDLSRTKFCITSAEENQTSADRRHRCKSLRSFSYIEKAYAHAYLIWRICLRQPTSFHKVGFESGRTASNPDVYHETPRRSRARRAANQA